ncbi:hypothetical protein JXB11_03870 [Candidatus Woesearchaeota archaeon]|nr:hypothetical protein [Candidatus Woesearchaeota archaeon]
MKDNKIAVEQLSANQVVNLALDTIKLGKQALVFVNTRPSAEKNAEEIAREIKEKKQPMLAQKALKALSKPTKQCERLSKCIEKGIAFHHSGLVAEQRELIEDNFRAGSIKIICCTPSLAMGVDLPAYRAIIRDLRRYGNRGLDWIPVLEYLQFAGRAGRPKFDKEGQAIIVVGSGVEKKEVHERYILGEPEEIYSKLAVEPVLRTYVLSLIATRFVRTKKELVGFFEKTFWAHQFEEMNKLEAIIDKMLALLEEWEFIKGSSNEFVSADEIGKDGELRATVIGKRVAELYIDPLSAHQIIRGMTKASGVGANSFSLLQLISSAGEMKPLLRVKTKEYEEVEAKIMEQGGRLLAREPSMFEEDYESFMNSVKTAMFFEEWISEMDEEYLLEKYSIRPGEIRAKLLNADWLLYAASELSRLLEFRQMVGEITKLRLRVKAGAKEELLPLLRFRNIGRVRARRLFNNRVRDIGDVKRADVSTLTQILGSGAVALDLKKQVGEKVEVVKKGKRKGQMSVEKY